LKIKVYESKVEVELKPGHADSEDLTAKESLEDGGYEVEKV